ncbi:MAG: hypothetical protein AAGD25_07695 [Cyanobacteria bacterium P01_F01_bin.150]
MLVILMDNQLLPSQSVCQGCVMADQQGRPRWYGGELLCGRALQCLPEDGDHRLNQYECQMGFRIAHIDG